jgi:hypothetical protein
VIRCDGVDVKFHKPTREAVRLLIEKLSTAFKKLAADADVREILTHFRSA